MENNESFFVYFFFQNLKFLFSNAQNIVIFNDLYILFDHTFRRRTIRSGFVFDYLILKFGKLNFHNGFFKF
jgi:hypothetical protein